MRRNDDAMEILAGTKKEIMDEIKIVDFEQNMLHDIMQLFYETVHTINAKDYNEQQLERWAPLKANEVSWKQRLNNNICKIALMDGMITGFAELTDDGHVDTLYVHKDYQGRGVASHLMDFLLQLSTENGFKELTTESSITAKPLFEKYGFEVTRVKTKLYNGKEFINYEMIKAL